MMSEVTRREALFTVAGLLTAARPSESRLSVEAYIFDQYAERRKKPLADILDEIFPMVRQAGFHNIEIGNGLLEAPMRERVLQLISANGLRLPSVYVGGGMHVKALAEKTIAAALEAAEICRPFGCVGIVNNPTPKSWQTVDEKTGDELAVQADALNRLGRALLEKGCELRVHHHTPELVNNAREWRHILHNTDAGVVSLCLDLDWAHQAGFEPLALLKEAGARVREVHVRNSKSKLWLESLQDGDIDYREIAAYFRENHLEPLIVVELAYRENTLVIRPLQEDLLLSRKYAENVFGLRA